MNYKKKQLILIISFFFSVFLIGKSVSAENYEENVINNGKSCINIYQGAYVAGPMVSCRKEVSSTCYKSVKADCIKEVKEDVYKTIIDTCYKTVPVYKSVRQSYRDTCYKTVPVYKSVKQSYSATCYKTVPVYKSVKQSYSATCYKTVPVYKSVKKSYSATCSKSVKIKVPIYKNKKVCVKDRYGRCKKSSTGRTLYKTVKYVSGYTYKYEQKSYTCTKYRTVQVQSGTKRQSYTCTKYKTVQVQSGTKQQSYSCTKYRTVQVQSGTKQEAYTCTKYKTVQVQSGTKQQSYSCSKTVFDRVRIVQQIHECTQEQAYSCKKFVDSLCEGKKVWKSKNKLLSTECVPDSPSVSSLVNGIKRSSAKQGQNIDVSFYSNDGDIDYYKIEWLGNKINSISNNYQINTASLSKGNSYNIKVSACNNKLGCSSYKTKKIDMKKYSLPFLE